MSVSAPLPGFFGNLSPSQEAALQAMKQRFVGDAHDNHTLLRFLRARQFVVANAAELYQNYLTYRKESGIERILNAKLPKADIYRRFVPHAFHGFDKEGRPVYWERTGLIDFPGLYRHMNDEDLMQWHFYQLELQIHRAAESSRRLGRVVDQFTNVVDLKGLNMSHRVSIGLVRAWAAHDQAYYPERMGRLYLVNAPWVFPFFWKICRTFVDENTASKIVVLGKDYKEQLLQFIDADQLPEEYGGTCKCADKGQDRCLPMPDIADLLHDDMQELTTDAAVEKTVNRQETFELELVAGPHGAVFDWVWQTTKDIKFSVEVVPLSAQPVVDSRASELKHDPELQLDEWTHDRAVKAHAALVSPRAAEPMAIVEPERIQQHRGSYSTQSPAVVRFRFDNTYSRFTAKTLKYVITCTPLESTKDAVNVTVLAGQGQTSEAVFADNS